MRRCTAEPWIPDRRGSGGAGGSPPVALAAGMRHAVNYWVVIYRFAWGALLVLCAIGLILIFIPKINEMRELRERREAFEKETAATRDAIRERMIKLERFADDAAFVERTAREEGMIKTNEVLFRFPARSGDETTTPSPAGP